jgi:hypothetical protein
VSGSSAKNFALFFTAGVSDLKFVGEDGTLLELARPRNPTPDYATIREVHQALLARKDAICVYPFDEVALPPRKPDADINFWKGDDPLGRLPVGADMADRPLLRTPDGKLVLAADKFRTAWDWIRRKGGTVIAILGFRTWRSSRDDEPIAAEEIVFDALKRATQPRHEAMVNYVEGDISPAAPFAAATATRIEAGVRECREKLGREEVRALLAVSGGIPHIKDILRAAVELQFGSARLLLDREAATSATLSRVPLDALIARRHALQFVRRGAFIDAAAVAMPFKDDEEARDQWVRPLRCAARLLDGNPVVAYGTGSHPAHAAEWEKSKGPPIFLRQIASEIFPGRDKPKRRSLLVAIRTEAALRSDRPAAALSLTVTFFDAALRDGVERRFGLFDGNDARLIRLHRELTLEQSHDLLVVTPDGNKPCLTSRREDGLYRFNSSTAHDMAWCAHLGQALRELCAAISPELAPMMPRRMTIRDIRNLAQHNVLTEEQLAYGIKLLEKQGLWREGSFLKSTHAEAVLRLLGYDEGKLVFERIVAGLERALLGAR